MHFFSVFFKWTVATLNETGLPRILTQIFAVVIDSVVVGLFVGVVILTIVKSLWFVFSIFYRRRYGADKTYPGLSRSQEHVFTVIIVAPLGLLACYGIYHWVQSGWIISGNRHSGSDHRIYWALQPYQFQLEIAFALLRFVARGGLLISILKLFRRP